MEHIALYDRKKPVHRLSKITEKTIALVYYEEEDWYGQCIAAECLRAPRRQLLTLFNQLGRHVSGELAHILCIETRMYKKKNFTMRSRTRDSFYLYRSGVYLKKFIWREFESIQYGIHNS